MRLERYFGARFGECFYALIKKLAFTYGGIKGKIYRKKKGIHSSREVRREAMPVPAIANVGNDERLN